MDRKTLEERALEGSRYDVAVLQAEVDRLVAALRPAAPSLQRDTT